MSKTLQWKWRSQLQLCRSTVLLLLLEEWQTWLRSPWRQEAQNTHFVTINRWQFCSVTEMYAPVYPPSVVASVSYCALPLCLPAFGGDTLFKCYFYPNTKRGLARDGPTCAGALCRSASAMFGQKIRLRVMFTNTWKPTLSSHYARPFITIERLSSHDDQTGRQMKVSFSWQPNTELQSNGLPARRPESR